MPRFIRGERPRPRVAILGKFPDESVQAFERMFPTLYKANTLPQLEELVDVRELDVLIVGEGISTAENWSWNCHVICFSPDFERLPGPLENSHLNRSGVAKTEAFAFPELPLAVARRREVDLAQVDGVRGWPKMELDFFRPGYHSVPQDQKERSIAILEKGVVIAEKITGEVLSAFYLRPDEDLGVAWLPIPDFVRHKWVALLLQQWAVSDPDALSGFSDWQESAEWMTAAERQIIVQIENAKKQKQAALEEFDSRIADLEASLSKSNREANENERHLITSQGQDLVDEVACCFRKMGFGVVDVDATLDPNAPKREDLRLSDPDDANWVALVEVRGYSRSAGKTNDLIRMSRFADLYNQENGRYPDMRIYVVNGETELSPDQRTIPLLSALEDAEIFAESNGLVIWSLDLFRVIHSDEQEDAARLKESVKASNGIWLRDMDSG